MQFDNSRECPAISEKYSFDYTAPNYLTAEPSSERVLVASAYVRVELVICDFVFPISYPDHGEVP
jgi:hypothetical protein